MLFKRKILAKARHPKRIFAVFFEIMKHVRLIVTLSVTTSLKCIFDLDPA